MVDTNFGNNTYAMVNTNFDGFVSDRQQHREEKPENVRRRKKALVLLALYLLLLVIPYPLTCVMVYRPLRLPSYVNFRSEYKVADFELNYRAQVIIGVLNSIRAVATVPLVGVVLAQLAVIHAQTRAAKSRQLSLAETLRLADRGWTDPQHLLHAIRRRQGFLPFGAFVLLIFAIAQPLEQLLVQTTTLKVLTCDDNLKCGGSTRPIGYDPSPNAVVQAPLYQIMRAVSSEITTASDSELNPYLWTKDYLPATDEVTDTYQYAYPSTLEDSTSFFKNDKPFQSQPFWASTLPNGTTTGVLREHAMRLNSSVKCEAISADEFPSPCPGDRPFVTSWAGEDDWMNTSLTICAPGNYSQSPWSRTRDREDIWEKLYINAWNAGGAIPINFTPFTVLCEAVTTRGYFELGNHFNGDIPQPLLATWPTMEEMHENFADYELEESGTLDYKLLAANDSSTKLIYFPGVGNTPKEYLFGPDDFYDYPVPAPGPLVMTALASFGNQSLVGIMANNPTRLASEIICANIEIPFMNFEYNSFYPGCGPEWRDTPERALSYTLGSWIELWRYIEDLEKFLSFSMFFANHATLAKATNYREDYSANIDDEEIRPLRLIYESEGYTTQKPTARLASIICLAALYSTQLIILINFAVYIWRHPTWTNGLDSFSMARLIARLDKGSLEELAGPDEGPELSKRRLSDEIE